MRGLWQAIQESEWTQICKHNHPNLPVPRLTVSQHKQHSPPCNPELKLNSHIAAAGLGGMGVNVAGLPGIDEGGMM